MRTAIRPILVISMVLSAACDGADSAAERSGVVYDSAGVLIVDNGALDLGESLPLAPTPTLQIGVVEGGEEYQLCRVTDVKRLSDGAVAVANGGTRELRIYGADGTHRATAGGAGEGPSEFRYPRAIVILPEDTIQVQDFFDRVRFRAERRFRAPRDDAPTGARGGAGFATATSWAL